MIKDLEQSELMKLFKCVAGSEPTLSNSSSARHALLANLVFTTKRTRAASRSSTAVSEGAAHIEQVKHVTTDFELGSISASASSECTDYEE